MKHKYKATFIDLNGETIYRCVDCGKMTTISRLDKAMVIAETVIAIGLFLLALAAAVWRLT